MSEAAGISAEGALAFMGQTGEPAPPAPAAPVEAPPAAAEPAPSAETTPPAPEPSAPTPVTLADNTIVVDPADGQQKTWGEIKSERLRQADYTRKTMELAEQRRQFAADKAAEQAAKIAAEVKKATDALPEDDPYAAGQRLLFQQMNALTEAQQQERAWLEEQRVAAARTRLEAEEAQASEQYKLAARERDIVGQQLYARISSGDHAATFSAVAKEFAEWRDALRKEAEEAGVKSWQEKHRVGAGTAAAPAPVAAGTPPPPMDMRSDSFIDLIKAKLSQ